MTDPAEERDYLRKMGRAREALSEGCCPICAARLAPEERLKRIEFAGRCDEHGLFEIEGEITHHTITITPFIPHSLSLYRIPVA